MPHELNKATGEYIQKDINFSKWNDINNIDFNGWWQIEVLDDSTKAVLRSFNNGKFLVYNANDKSNWLNLTQDKDDASIFEFISIVSDLKDINDFTEDEVFKLKIVEKEDKSSKYLCIDDSDNNMFFDDKQLDIDWKEWSIKIPAEDNTYDSFKIIIPVEEKYLELSLWIDSREYIQLFISKLETTQDFMSTLVHIKDGLSKVLLKILQFIQNQLNGKIRSDFAIGQIIPHRQDMISKVGMLFQLMKLLNLILTNALTTNKRSEILKSLFVSYTEFHRFENILEIIIKTINLTIVDNLKNVIQLQSHTDTIQPFYFIRGWTDLLNNIFKSKDYEINRKEVHTELMYKRIYEIEKFRSAILYFTDNLRK